MMDELQSAENFGSAFEGQGACVRCFLHILNLVAKALIRPFDAKKDKNDKDAVAGSDKDATLLAKLAEELRGYDDPQLAGW